jgi:hypothetical protein
MAQGQIASRGGLWIGVTGHRKPPKLPRASLDAVRATVGRVIDALNSGDAVVVSSLAEGTDQIVAEEALARDLSLHAILPFSAPKYRRDFKDAETAGRFDALLKSSPTSVELDFDCEVGAEGYEAAGHAMLATSDVLIAVWDGEDAAGRGGTAHIVARALDLEVPVILIDPAMPDRVSIDDAGHRTIGFDGLAALSDRLRQ